MSGSIECGVNWQEFQKHCYYFQPSQTSTWDEAEGECSGQTSYLVTVESEEENNFIVDYVASEYPLLPDMWIGMKRSNSSGT